MANKVLTQEMDGTPKQIVFADFADDFNPTAANDLQKGTPTEVQLALVGVADGAAYQSAKFDFEENRAQAYVARCAFEMAATPGDGAAIYLYLAPSHSSTAANGNPGGVTGVAGAYAGYSANMASSLKQLDQIGVFVCTVQTTTTVQIGVAGVFMPTERYGSLVVRNESGAAFHSDDVECHVVFDPIVPEIQ